MSLLDKFIQTRKRTEDLVAPLELEDYTQQPIYEVSPPRWQLGHTTWFYEGMVLEKYLPEYQPFHGRYGEFFNSYFLHAGEMTHRDHRGHISRPTVKEILRYRDHVTEAVAYFWEKMEKHERARDVLSCFELAINHEQQHQELLLTDIKYILGTQPLFPEYLKEDAPDTGWKADHDMGWNKIDGGIYTIGYEGNDFCWDCEKECHEVLIRDFQLANRPVTNGEYLEFIEEGGYRQFNWWLDDAWSWINEKEIQAPLYWNKIDGEWWIYTLGGLNKLDPNGPLMHVSYYEAEAFARWKGCRLPTEFEWEAAFQVNPEGMQSPVWEWTGSAYLPYPGFKTPEGALGEYNGKFMIGQMVLRGGSLATPEGHWRPSYRNFFYPESQWQFSGIRLAKD